ncbi:MAG: septum formation inhibitor Maf [Campylobacteraceae bacterium]|nr:septum formation inhibitor Maf [Campylobacteraceae bacterium]
MIRLGSNSPTRAIILKEANISFVQNGGSFDEDKITTTDPKAFVYEATQGKYKELYEKYGVNDMPLLVADSVVTSGGELLRKAKDENDVRRMLKLQSGSETSVITCMIYKALDTEIIDISITTYMFASFEEKHIEEYIASGECYGKAGAIMVEGFCKRYIKEVKGYESNAMGLCIEKLIPFLEESSENIKKSISNEI